MMYQGRYTMAQSSAVRKPRVDGKPSMLPKPRRPASIDRASMEARRPSGAHRSSSAEPVRATMGPGGHLSREASATKIPLNRKSKTQQAESRYGQSSITPMRGTQYSRPTTTPVRTPSEDRMSRSWQASVERALAFVTMKDLRPISNVAWQRAELSRVQEALSARAGVGGEAGMALIRPLTIARFVDIAGTLLSDIVRDIKLNNDNYVAKLPHLAKRFLYPGAVSKSWLKTVNTLHAFPHALAFIGYFLDLVNHIEMQVSDDWLYIDKDELSCLRRDYLHKCWIRFQEPDHVFDDLNAEYLSQLKQLLGDDDHKIANLKEVIKQLEASLEDEEEAVACASEKRIRERRDALAAALRAVRADRVALRGKTDEHRARKADHAAAVRSLDADIAAITTEIQELKQAVESQTMTVAERARLLDEVDYATRVIDSKRTLAEQINKMILSKETELALWQKRTLDSCVEYKQALIHLSAQFPELAALAVDEKELMSESCAVSVGRAVETLRTHAAALAEQRALRSRARSQLARQRSHELEETRAKIAELKSLIEREQQALEIEMSREASEAAEWAAARQRLADSMEAFTASESEHSKAQAELEFWEKQDHAWRTKLAEMHKYIESLKEQLARQLVIEKQKRASFAKELLRSWNEHLDAVEREERALEEIQREGGEKSEVVV